MRFINVAGELTLQAKFAPIRGNIIYRVIPYPKYDSEYEIANWYTGTHPDAPYQSNIIVARPGPNRTRVTMFNRRVTVRYATGEADKRQLKDEADFRFVLRSEFGLNMTDEEIHACIDVMERKGEKGAPHPFFACNPDSICATREKLQVIRRQLPAGSGGVHGTWRWPRRMRASSRPRASNRRSKRALGVSKMTQKPGPASPLRQHRLGLRGIVLDAIKGLPRHPRRLHDRARAGVRGSLRAFRQLWAGDRVRLLDGRRVR